jgi:hypothetical protein
MGLGPRNPGVKKAPDPGSGSATLGCNLHNKFVERNFGKIVGYWGYHHFTLFTLFFVVIEKERFDVAPDP